jgi:PIN domain nuclease of toxin-antitoxin system
LRLLLDSHALLWFDGGDRRLSPTARQVLEDQNTDLLVSVASIWELAIKSSRGRLTLPKPIYDYVIELEASGYYLLPILAEHAAAVATLPSHHRDPFDRLLAAQALAEQIALVTRDRIFKKYGINVIW